MLLAQHLLLVRTKVDLTECRSQGIDGHAGRRLEREGTCVQFFVETVARIIGWKQDTRRQKSPSFSYNSFRLWFETLVIRSAAVGSLSDVANSHYDLHKWFCFSECPRVHLCGMTRLFASSLGFRLEVNVDMTRRLLSRLSFASYGQQFPAAVMERVVRGCRRSA